MHKQSIVQDRKSLRLRKYSQFSAILLAVTAFLSSGKDAMALTADDVLNKMTVEERTAHLTGIVGGMAYSRYLRDKPDQTGMSCIYDWYYTGGKTRHQQIEQWIERHLDKTVEPLLYVLIKKDCGD